VIFRLNPVEGQPLYLQLMQQIRHAVETGVLQDGDLLPGIRTLALELVVSHNTVAKAYSELEHEGLLELRHGSGAYVSAGRRRRLRSEKVLLAQDRVRSLIEDLNREGLSAEELRRLFEAAIISTIGDYDEQPARRRNK
jgi:GntR family transcriptional regulator